MDANQLLEKLTQACQAKSSAVRVITRLLPAGTQTDKVFPPTYASDKKNDPPRYHSETRLIDGREVKVVVLDSVQAQANSLEEALLTAFDAGECNIPVLSVEIPGHGRITALDAPHRVSDAIFRDSLSEGVAFRESVMGKAVTQARVNNATAFFQYCPTALIFGTWDSHGGEGVRSAKVQRALTSEIVGLNAVFGRRSASRHDPLGIVKAVDIYRHATDHWTLDQSQAALDKQGQPAKFGKEGKPSEIGHGNVTPTLSEAGGVTISEAVQTTVLSFVQLRRLRFPAQDNQTSLERDVAGRTVLAALALYAIVLQLEEGYDLRSRCLLLPAEQPQFELLGSTIAEIEKFTLDKAVMKQAFDRAYEYAKEVGLTWQPGIIPLNPSNKLVELVRRSDALTNEIDEESKE